VVVRRDRILAQQQGVPNPLQGVANEQLGGTRSSTGHDITIEVVDEPMGDELFPPEPSRWSRFPRRP
jgi:hypothetical protein